MRNARQGEASFAAKQGTVPSPLAITESLLPAISQGARVVTTNSAVNTISSNGKNIVNMDGSFVKALFGGEVLKGTTTLQAKRNAFRLTKGRELLGAEIALVALLVSASVTKERAAQKKAELANIAANAELAKLSDSGVDVTELNDFAPKYKALTRPTWLVRHNEDLVKLAEHLFHEAELGWLIADLNIGQTKESYMDGKRVVELRARQRIDLPVWQDIVEFHKARESNAKPENLVTIVTEAEIDTELMNTKLGLAMGATGAPAKPALPAKPIGIPAAAFAIAGDTPMVKENRGQLILSKAKKAALVLRRAASAVAADHQDQGPTGGATVTEELTPVHV